MEMNIVVLLILYISIGAVVMQPYMYSRIMHVASQNHSDYIISSNTGVKNRGSCAMLCKTEECFSFSYNEGDNKCDTYSRYFVDTDNEEEADMSMSTLHFSRSYYRSCSYVGVGSPSGVYRIQTLANKIINVFCDMDTAGGPWTVIQRRIDGEVDFYRNWTDYKNGFGDLNGEFWIGNDNLHHLTNAHSCLRVELESWDGTKGFAQYSMFQVADEDQNYKLAVQGFSGNVYDSFDYHDGQNFSTPDRDNEDRYNWNCAETGHGSWWCGKYSQVNLNGDYRVDYGSDDTESMFWYRFPPYGSFYTPLKTSVMMIQ